MTTVLAIDQGTTATKAVVIGPDEEVLAHEIGRASCRERVLMSV